MLNQPVLLMSGNIVTPFTKTDRRGMVVLIVDGGQHHGHYAAVATAREKDKIGTAVSCDCGSHSSNGNDPELSALFNVGGFLHMDLRKKKH